VRASESKAHADLTEHAYQAACGVPGVTNASVRLEWRADGTRPGVARTVDSAVIDDFEIVVSFSGDDGVQAVDVRAAVATSFDRTAAAVRVERVASAVPVPITNPRLHEEEQPLDEVEAAVAEIWQQVLRQEEVGPSADFFDLGGDSLTGIMVIGRLNTLFGSELEVADLYDLPTVAEIAHVLRAST
jgi:acyl carrier protein